MNPPIVAIDRMAGAPGKSASSSIAKPIIPATMVLITAISVFTIGSSPFKRQIITEYILFQAQRVLNRLYQRC